MSPRNPDKTEQTKIAELVEASRKASTAAQHTAQAHEIAATRAQAANAAADAYAAELRQACGVPAGIALNDAWQWCDREGRRLVADVPRAVESIEADAKAAEG